MSEIWQNLTNLTTNLSIYIYIYIYISTYICTSPSNANGHPSNAINKLEVSTLSHWQELWSRAACHLTPIPAMLQQTHAEDMHHNPRCRTILSKQLLLLRRWTISPQWCRQRIVWCHQVGPQNGKVSGWIDSNITRYPAKASFSEVPCVNGLEALDASLFTGPCSEKLHWFPGYSLPILLGVLLLNCNPENNGVGSLLSLRGRRFCHSQRFSGTNTKPREQRPNTTKPDTFDLQSSIDTAWNADELSVLGPITQLITSAIKDMSQTMVAKCIPTDHAYSGSRQKPSDPLVSISLPRWAASLTKPMGFPEGANQSSRR